METAKGLSPQDYEIARTLLKNLKGERYKDWNYLFLTPFDLAQVPGYLDIVAKPLDLQTVTQNLEGGVYKSLPEVWTDIEATFENANKYHGVRETKWIAKMARDMIKYFKKERKSAERGKSAASTSSTGSKPIIKLKVGKQLPTAAKAAASSGKQLPLNATTSAPPPGGGGGGTAAATVAAAMAAPKPKKAKIKVKLSTKKTAAEAPAAAASASNASPTKTSSVAVETTKTKPLKPVIRLKLKAPAGAASSSSSTISSKPTAAVPSSTSAGSTKAPVAAPSSTTSSEEPPAPAPQSSSTTTKASSSSKSSKSSNKIAMKLGNSRGKELPKGVVQPNKSTTTSSKSTSAAPSKSTSATASKSTSATASKSTSATASKSTSATASKSTTAASVKPAKSTAAKSTAAKSTTPGVATSKCASAAPPPTTSSNASAGNASTSKVGQKRKRTKKSVGSTKESGTVGRGGGLPPAQFQACAKILLALKRRHQTKIPMFLTPVCDKAIIQDYRTKIKHPMDIGKMSTKVESKAYKSLADFCLDLRRIFSNCLCYNASMKDSIRSTASEILGAAEDLMAFFFAQVGSAAYPRLLYCWKLCLDVLGTLYNVVNPVDGEPTVLYFLHPVSIYCGGQFPQDYLEKVKRPMDFQTVTSNLLEGRYQSVAEFANDCKLIVQNCSTYYSGRDDGVIYIEQANRLGTVMKQQLEQLERYEKSSKGSAEKLNANTVSLTVLRPPVPVLSSVLDDLRNLEYSDKATKIVEPAMGPFEKPVSLALFGDYLQYISEPMDLQAVERKMKNGAYTTPEEFEYDMSLIFRNCEKYHSERKGEHLVSMAKYGAKNFRKIFYARMKALEDPSVHQPMPETAQSQQQAPPPDTTSSSVSQGATPPAKKQKVEVGGVSKGKVAPRISITLSAAATASVARAKSPKVTGPAQKKNTTSPKVAAVNQPVPLHIAIAKVKEAFPLRRAVKSLQSWEADCARYFKELLRHPWLSAARPKFIFQVPVTMLFPELREAYAAKIRKPMDLTTVECTLLAGNRYASCDDLIDDVALTFSNAIRFNKDGRDIGDPLSCAYYDASVHLLRYARWLSLELLSAYVTSNDHADEGGEDGLPPLSWTLTAQNREIARKEQTDIVLKEPIEKSLEGDRYTWHESECEKLLKALRHQSDVKYMTFFIRADYPADYTAFISKPMDWEKVQRNLKKRHYDNFGQVIEDLRLIFKNALKYNARLRDRADTVSGRAYAAAEYMSAKLENSIRKLMLTVSDRIERERIDHSNAEREMDAEERAEEARLRAAWKKDPNNKDGSSPPPFGGDRGPDNVRSGGGQKIRLVRRAAVRREATDFEVPFFDDEDDGQHERSVSDLIKMQKSMFEKQRQELVRMRQTSMNIGSAAYSRFLQRSLAQEWAGQKLKQTPDPVDPMDVEPHPAVVATGDTEGQRAENEKRDMQQPSSVLKELERSDRGQIKISLKTPAGRKSGKKRPRPFEF